MKSVLLSGVSLFVVTVAAAQEASVVYLDPITVYGDRSAETSDQTQSSVAIIGSDRLGTPTAQSIPDAFRQSVNVTNGDFTESGFVIRGINSEGMTPGGAGAPLASLYIDGVQQTVEGARRGMRSLFDAEQMEIYRGPQSTLTGRNALAGAIYLRTKDPEFGEASGTTELTLGENNRQQLGVAYGAQLSDRLAFRFSGIWSEKDSDLNYDSYQAYPYYDDMRQDKYYTLRGKLLWRPTGSEDTEVLFSYSHSYDSPESNMIAGPGWDSSTSFADRRGDIYGSIYPVSFFGVSPLPIWQDVRDTTVESFGVEVTHAINPNLTLTAQTSYSESDTDRRSINLGFPTGSPFASEAWTVDGGFDQKILSQELRLNYEGSGLRWVGGLYFADENTKGARDQFAINGAFNSVETTSTRNESDISNYAAFGELTYEFAPDWNVIVGARLDYYKQSQTATVSVVDAFSGPVSSSSSASSHSETAFLPKLGVTYDINANNKLGLVYQEAYRPGGSGVRADTGTAYSYESESAKNLELSWKSRQMDGRLNIGANLFYQDWDNQQVEVWQVAGNANSSQILNAGESSSYGGELELEYKASDSLNLYAAVGLLHTEFKDFVFGNSSLSGAAFSNAPEQTVVLGFQWGRESGWFGGGNIKYVGSSLSRIETTGRPELASYTTVDAQFGYAWDNGFKVTGYATNLLDEEYFTYNAAPGNLLASIGARREVGLRLTKNF